MKIKMNIASVVVWFNPDNSCVKNILSYSNYFDKIYIIDNSSINNEYLAQQINNSIYLPMFTNTGIAKALNTGCTQAINEGFTFVMTMDQDSSFNDLEIKQYLSFVYEYSVLKQYYIYCPGLNNKTILSTTESLKNCIKKILNYKTEKLTDNETTEPCYAITSGSIISLEKWKELQGFNEDFFIDEVDHEFTLRLTKLYPQSILRFNNIKMNHRIGDIKKSFFKRNDFHSPVRLYYMVRNSYYIKDLFPDFSNQYKRIERLKKIFKENIRDLKFKHCFYMLKGYFDYKKNIKGQLNE